MHEIVEQLLSYVRGTWRYRWYALGLAWLICIGGWAFVYKLPDVYQSSARVYVDTQTVLRPLLRGLTIDLNPESQVSLMTRTLLSTPNVEKIARMTDLDLKVRDKSDMDRLVRNLQNKINLSSGRGENLYTISVTDPNPQLAQKIVQSVLTIFVEDTLGAARQDSDTAQRFIDQQIREYENRLAVAERRLVEFKRKHFGIMPGRGEGYYDAMQTIADEIEQARLDLQQAENRRNSLKQQIENGKIDYEELYSLPSYSTAPADIVLPIDSRIQALEQNLDELLLRYTERHPDVIATREAIAQLQQRREQELAERMASMAAAGGNREAIEGNPVIQQMKIALAQEEANVAALQAQVKEYEQRLQDLEKNFNLVPEVEVELQSLNRDYGVTKSNYEQLLARRESLNMSQQVEENTDTIRFKVVDPAQLPTKPSGPNREMLLSFVLAVGAGGGIGLAFLLSQLWPTFDSRRELMEATNLPVLGSITMAFSREGVRRQRLELATYCSLTVCLLAAYSGLLVLQVTGGIRIPFI